MMIIMNNYEVKSIEKLFDAGWNLKNTKELLHILAGHIESYSGQNVVESAKKGIEIENTRILATAINGSSEISDRLAKVNLLLTFFAVWIAWSTFLLQYFEEYKSRLWLVWVISLILFLILNEFYIHKK